MSIPQGEPEFTHGDHVNLSTLPRNAACPICDSEDATRIFFAKDRSYQHPGIFGIYRCPHCYAVFVQPRINDQELASYFPQEHGRARASKRLNKKNYTGWRRFVLEHSYGYPRSDGRGSRPVQQAAAFMLSWFTAKGVIPYHGDGKILNIGEDGGSYLYRLKQWGWETYGVEARATEARRARSLGLTVHHGTLTGARFPNAFFDVVRLSKVLERLPDPVTVFEEINRILKPNGLVYVIVPNTRSLVFWLFRENWYALDAPRQMVSYCPATLDALCATAGFEIAHMEFTDGRYDFVRSLAFYFEAKGKHWPAWVRHIRWERNKLARHALDPLFFFVDALGYGDVLHATLRKKPCRVITGAEIFDRSRHRGPVTDAPVRLSGGCEVRSTRRYAAARCLMGSIRVKGTDHSRDKYKNGVGSKKIDEHGKDAPVRDIQRDPG
jgi:SAM-dependent methyltransferase